MKPVKIISALFIFVILLNVSVCEIFGQGTDRAKPIVNTPSTAERKIEKAEVVKVENSGVQKNNDLSNSINPNKDLNSERYRIGYQDTIEVNVFRHPELSQTVAVNLDGTINLPRIETPVIAVCKTQEELKNSITTLYKNYLRNPFVNVRVSDQRSQSFGVVGAVHKPGTFYLSRPVRLFELLSLAGGQDVEFAGGKIQLARLGNVTGCQENTENRNDKTTPVFISYRLKDVTEGKENPWMQPGDIISVLKSEEAYVVGNVFKPAKVQLDEPKTLTQAIAIAGGLDGTANTQKVIIQRQATGDSPKMDLVFNLKDITDKKTPDPLLQANDIVAVGNDKFKSIGKGLVKALSGGVGNLFYRIP
jgi:polysaccharide export outer membrane protein